MNTAYPDFKIRTATLADVDFMTEVALRATAAQGRLAPDFDEDEFREGFGAWTRETIMGAEPGCTLSVIEIDSVPIGRLRVVRTDDALTLAGIQLLPTFQNQRIGSRIINQLQEETRKSGLPMHLSVELDNPHAKRLYERLGFQVIGQNEREYEMEWLP